MGVMLSEYCGCTVHESLKKLSLHKPNGHTLHNLMRVNRALYNEVEAAMHRLVPILVFLQGPTYGDEPEELYEAEAHKLRPTSTILSNLRRTQNIILQSAIPYANELSRHADAAAVITFFDWWYARTRSQARLRVRLGEFTIAGDFDPFLKMDYWLSEEPRNLRNLRFVFDGIEDCEESIRTCVVTYEQRARGIFHGPSLDIDSMERVRWFCRRHPGLIESSTDWAKVAEKEKDEYR